ncbi:Uncharacterized protein Fot_09082 [Forsythia ovata]|uniref:Uncharacterized protein n=1 Tax=Forsythia ovata TaxID=205694 RepID=A0ABD1WD92_9LAMI
MEVGVITCPLVSRICAENSAHKGTRQLYVARIRALPDSHRGRAGHIHSSCITTFTARLSQGPTPCESRAVPEFGQDIYTLHVQKVRGGTTQSLVCLENKDFGSIIIDLKKWVLLDLKRK